MRVTLKSNGHTEILLEPETPIEKLFVETMALAASRGQHVKLETISAAAEAGMVLSVGGA